MNSIVGGTAGAAVPSPFHLGSEPLSFAPNLGLIGTVFDPKPCEQLLHTAIQDEEFRNGFMSRLGDINITELVTYLDVASKHQEEYMVKLGLVTLQKLGGLTSFLCQEVIDMRDDMLDAIVGHQEHILSLEDKNRQLQTQIDTVQALVPMAPKPLSDQLHHSTIDFVDGLRGVSDVEKSALCKLTANFVTSLDDFTLAEASAIPKLLHHHSGDLIDAVNVQLDAEVQNILQETCNCTDQPVIEKRGKPKGRGSNRWKGRERAFKNKTEQLLCSSEQCCYCKEKSGHQPRAHLDGKPFPGAFPTFRADDATTPQGIVGLPVTHQSHMEPARGIPQPHPI